MSAPINRTPATTPTISSTLPLQALNHHDSIIVLKLAYTTAIAIKIILLPSAVCKFSCGNISDTIRILLNTGSK